MTKKIFIGAIVFFVLAAGAAVYLLFFRQTTAQNPNSEQGSASTGYQPFPITSSGEATPAGTSLITGTSTGPAPSVTIQTLTHLYTSPIAGAGIIANKSGEFVRLTDRATGNMYSISLATSSLGLITEISNQTIPEVYESLWLANSSTTLLRYLDDNGTTIKTYSATLVAAKNTGASSSPALASIVGSFLPDNIEEVAANPSGSQIFYLIESADGITGKIATPSNGNASTIFTSAVSDWNVQWPAAGTIALSTKASSVARGYLYFVSAKGAVQRVLGDIGGLVTTVDPSVTFIAYSDNTPALSIFTIKTDTAVSTGLSTIADKCAWSLVQKGVLYCAVPASIPNGHYPDSWYQGLVSFSDTIFRIDANSGQATEIANLAQQSGQSIDAENLTMAPNDDYLLFTNKSDLSLWSLQLQPNSQ